MAVDCVFSAETPVFAQPDGSVCENRATHEDGTRLTFSPNSWHHLEDWPGGRQGGPFR